MSSRYLHKVIAVAAAACLGVGTVHALEAEGQATTSVGGGTFDLNAFLGADRYYTNATPINGQNTVTVNLEAGHIWNGHEALQHVTTFYNSADTFGGGAVAPLYDRHATWVGLFIGGRATATNSSIKQMGLAPGTDLRSAAVATFWTNSAYSQSFFWSANSCITAYAEAFAAGDVVNSSYGYTDPGGADVYTVFSDAMAFQNPETLHVVSAGNSGPGANTVGAPGSGYNTLTVGALDSPNSFDSVAWFSSRGPQDFSYYDYAGGVLVTVGNVRAAVDISAPGTSLVSAFYGGQTGGNNPTLSGSVNEGTNADAYSSGIGGTSFASPIVAGGASLVYSAAKTLPVLSNNAEATQNMVVKSLLLTAADKTSNWSNGQYTSNGIVTTTQSLDWEVGAGRMNLERTFDVQVNGQTGVTGQSVGAQGAVSGTGWDYGAAQIGINNDYTFSEVLLGGSTFTTSLSWMRDRKYAGGYVDDWAQADLNLSLWSLGSDNSFQTKVAESVSLYNTVEHLSFALPQTGIYGLRVSYATNTFDNFGLWGTPPYLQGYGVAWDGDTVSALYWAPTGTNTTAHWDGTTTNFSTSSGGPAVSAATTTNTRVILGGATNGAATVVVGGERGASGLLITNGSVTFQGTNSSSITLAANGISILSGVSGAVFQSSVGLVLGASQSWDNASSQSMTVEGAITGNGDLALKASSTGSINISGGVNHAGLLANNGAGSGASTISGVIGTNVTGVLQDSSTSMLVLNGSAPNQYTGDTTVRTGTLVVDFANAAAATNLISSDSRLVLGGAGGSDGGTLRILQKNGVATSQTFDGTLVASGASVVEAANVGGSAGVGLTVNLGAIAQTNGGTVAFLLPEFGSITTANANVNGILGSWATVGTGASARYATVSGGAIAALAGTAAADASQITDTTGIANYDLASGGVLAGGVSFNSLRFTGSAASLSNNFTANGLLNAGTGNLDVAGRVTAGDARNLVVNASSGAVNLAGAVADNPGGASAFTKAGAGIVLLDATNSYTGNTYVNEGKLVVDGSIASSARTFVTTGGVLAGHGTVGNLTLQSGGTGSPGNSPGTQTVAGNLEWEGGADYNWDIHDAKGTAGNLLGWDLYAVTGQLDLTALSLTSKFNINLWSLSAVATDVSGDAINFDYAQNYTWTIVAAAGGITGFNADYFNINTAATNGTGGFSNDLFGGYFGLRVSGNNLNLTFTTAVPEPGTWVAGGVLLLASLVVRYRRGSSVSRSRSPR